MKKLVIIFACFFSINLYALETETFITGAYSYCLFTEKAEEGTTKIFSNAFDLSISSYFNQNYKAVNELLCSFAAFFIYF